jgi:hypothetical protein
MGLRDDCDFGEIRVMARDWPIVLTEFPEKAVADPTLRSVFDHLEAMMIEAGRSKEKLFVITDIARMRHITPARQRQLAADWMKRVVPLTRSATVGGATVAPSAILRGIFTAVHWLQPSPTPYFCVATRRQAMLKGIELLEAGHVPLSPSLITYRENAVRPAV